MKRFILISIFISTFCFGIVGGIHAQNATSSGTPTPTKDGDDSTRSLIDNLKERIASRVAQLKLVEKRGTIGRVTATSDTQITLTDGKDNTRYIDVDELTKFASPSADSFGISDIKEGVNLGVLGLYNKQSRRILARFVDVITVKQFIPGTVINVDEDNFAITITTKEKKEYIVDIERVTKTFAHSKEEGLLRSGFSKITPEMHVLVIGFTDIKDSNRIIGSRILLFPQIPKNPEIETGNIQEKPTPTPDKTPVSTGSGKKLTPTTR